MGSFCLEPLGNNGRHLKIEKQIENKISVPANGGDFLITLSYNHFMILAPHMLVGVVLTKFFPVNIWLFLLILLSHYVLDTLPHREYVETMDDFKKVGGYILLDLLTGFLLSFWLVGISWVVCGAIFFALLPDLPILLLAFYRQNKFLKNYSLLNHFFHFCYPTSAWLGVIVQLLVMISAILILMWLR